MGRSHFFLPREFGNQINQRLIRFAILWRKARDDVAEIAFVELRIFADVTGEEALSQRAKWNEPDPEFLECWYDLRLRLSPPKRIFALECRDRLNGVCATDRLHACFREA